MGWGPWGGCPSLPSTRAASLSVPLKGISLRAGLTLAIINRAKLGPLLAARCRVLPATAVPPRLARAESGEIYPKGGSSFSFLQQTTAASEPGPPLASPNCPKAVPQPWPCSRPRGCRRWLKIKVIFCISQQFLELARTGQDQLLFVSRPSPPRYLHSHLTPQRSHPWF